MNVFSFYTTLTVKAMGMNNNSRIATARMKMLGFYILFYIIKYESQAFESDVLIRTVSTDHLCVRSAFQGAAKMQLLFKLF